MATPTDKNWLLISRKEQALKWVTGAMEAIKKVAEVDEEYNIAVEDFETTLMFLTIDIKELKEDG